MCFCTNIERMDNLEKLLIPRMEAAQMLSISTKMIDRLANAGKIKKVMIGSRVYYSPEELKAFITKEGPLC